MKFYSDFLWANRVPEGHDTLRLLQAKFDDGRSVGTERLLLRQ